MRHVRQLQGQNGSGTVDRYEFRDLDEKLRYMRRLITLGREHPDVRQKAVEIIRSAAVQPKDKKAQALAIGQWVQDNVYYVLEFPERLAHAFRTLKDRAGDCDDTTILIGAMLESIGIPAVQVVMKVNGNWSHVFPAAKLSGLLPLDSTLNFPVRQVVNPIAYAYSKGHRVSLKLA